MSLTTDHRARRNATSVVGITDDEFRISIHIQSVPICEGNGTSCKYA